MAITFVAASAAGATASGTSVTVTKPAGTTADDLLVAYVTTVQGFTATAPSGWTLDHSFDGGTGVTCASFFKVAGASEPANYTFTNGQIDMAVNILAFRGVDGTGPVRDSATTGGGSTSATSPALTGVTATDMAVILAGARPDNSGNPVITMPGSPWITPPTAAAVAVGSFPSAVAAAYQLGGGTGTVTFAQRYEYGIVSIALVQGSGGGGGGTTGPGPTPTWVGAGSYGHAGTAGGMSPGLPAGWQAGDVFLMFTETMNGVGAANAPAGWTELPSSPQYANTGTNTTRTALNAYWRLATASETAPTFIDTGNHQSGIIHAFRGCDTSGNPWDDTAGANEATADTSGAAPSVTTTDVNRLVVAAGCWATDTTSPQIDSATNANLTSLTERSDDSTTDANGGGLAVYTGEKATAGATGATTFTYTTASAKGLLTVALKPPTITVPTTQDSVGVLIG